MKFQQEGLRSSEAGLKAHSPALLILAGEYMEKTGTYPLVPASSHRERDRVPL